MLDIMTMNVAATDATGMFSKLQGPLKEIKTGITGIASVVAALCIAVCLIGMLFSKNPKTVEEYKTWLKRAIICWVCLMILDTITEAIETLSSSI